MRFVTSSSTAAATADDDDWTVSSTTHDGHFLSCAECQHEQQRHRHPKLPLFIPPRPLPLPLPLPLLPLRAPNHARRPLPHPLLQTTDTTTTTASRQKQNKSQSDKRQDPSLMQSPMLFPPRRPTSGSLPDNNNVPACINDEAGNKRTLYAQLALGPSAKHDEIATAYTSLREELFASSVAPAPSPTPSFSSSTSPSLCDLHSLHNDEDEDDDEIEKEKETERDEHDEKGCPICNPLLGADDNDEDTMPDLIPDCPSPSSPSPTTSDRSEENTMWSTSTIMESNALFTAYWILSNPVWRGLYDGDFHDDREGSVPQEPKRKEQGRSKGTKKMTMAKGSEKSQGVKSKWLRREQTCPQDFRAPSCMSGEVIAGFVEGMRDA